MKRLLGMAALAGVGVLAYRAMQKRKQEHQQLQPAVGAQPVRDAGPESMTSAPQSWGRTDQRADQSFPASDPPGTY